MHHTLPTMSAGSARMDEFKIQEHYSSFIQITVGYTYIYKCAYAYTYLSTYLPMYASNHIRACICIFEYN